MKILKITVLMAFLMAMGILGFLSGAYLWVKEMAAPIQTNQKYELTIAPGTNTRQIATLLKNSNVIRSALLFRIYIRFLAVDQRLRPGTYLFAGSESLNEVIFKLLQGSLQMVSVTIPEGVTINRVAAILEENGICRAVEFIEAASDPALAGSIFSNWELIPAPEGLLFPDTYNFNRPTPAGKVAERMLRLTKHQIDRILIEPLPGSLSPYEVCILASIIEKEAALPDERPVIASVFYNRLEKRIKLESCATVLYAHGTHKSRLLFEDLKIDSPFNTYLNVGLPPTPIANFGTSSLNAASKPADTDYLFFVSDGKRGHKFSKSLSEHNRFRRDFFKTREK
ncbi:MAG: endolytic transglycosylase MltG [Erysipelotrichia bacterium]|nr:endolytic transglycosylase MltG [Erysipelotrichia bacterium]